jgi:hypothetical protein
MKKLIHHFLIPRGVAAVALALILPGLDANAAPAPIAAQAATAPVLQAAAQPQGAPERDIIDIRGPIHIPAPFPWLAWSAGGLLAAGIGAGAWAFLKRQRRKLPYEIALEKLEATRPLMEYENAKPFSLAVSEIVRLFIEECLPVRAAHRTTSEFFRDLVSLPESALAAHHETLAEFLDHCDLAKFARWSLTVPQMEAMLGSASAFVVAIGKPETSKKHPVTPPSPAAPELAAAHS